MSAADPGDARWQPRNRQSPRSHPTPPPGLDDTDLLRRALAELPARQRAAVVLRYHEGLSAAQTADLLGCSEGTARSQATRGLDKLRAALAADSHEISTGGDHD